MTTPAPLRISQQDVEPVPRAFHRVITDKGWSYVVGPTIAGRDGPWRYGWEAQELADELNGFNAP